MKGLQCEHDAPTLGGRHQLADGLDSAVVRLIEGGRDGTRHHHECPRSEIGRLVDCLQTLVEVRRLVVADQVATATDKIYDDTGGITAFNVENVQGGIFGAEG